MGMNTHDEILGLLLAALMMWKVAEYALHHEPRATTAIADYTRRAESHTRNFIKEHKLSCAAWGW